MAQPDDWRQLVLDELDARHKRAPRTSIGVNFHLDGHGLVLAAARARGMSLGAYTRRAAIAFAVADLGADWDEVMENEPRVGETARQVDPVGGRGLGYGAWKITGLEEYGPA
jgi:hypothetical protein